MTNLNGDEGVRYIRADIHDAPDGDRDGEAVSNIEEKLQEWIDASNSALYTPVAVRDLREAVAQLARYREELKRFYSEKYIDSLVVE